MNARLRDTRLLAPLGPWRGGEPKPDVTFEGNLGKPTRNYKRMFYVLFRRSFAPSLGLLIRHNFSLSLCRSKFVSEATMNEGRFEMRRKKFILRKNREGRSNRRTCYVIST